MGKNTTYSLHIHQRKKIHKDEVSILNIYASNARAPTFIKETLLKSHIEIMLILADFNNSLSPINGQVIQTETRERMELTFHPNTEEYTFLSALTDPFSKLNSYLVTKSQMILENRNNHPYLIRPHWIKAGYLEQHKQKANKLMEIEQFPP